MRRQTWGDHWIENECQDAYNDGRREALEGFEVEYRDVGEHDWRPIGSVLGTTFTCWQPDCGVGSVRFERDGTPCPSKRERRLVGPWEPVTEEAEG